MTRPDSATRLDPTNSEEAIKPSVGCDDAKQDAVNAEDKDGTSSHILNQQPEPILATLVNDFLTTKENACPTPTIATNTAAVIDRSLMQADNLVEEIPRKKGLVR